MLQLCREYIYICQYIDIYQYNYWYWRYTAYVIVCRISGLQGQKRSGMTHAVQYPEQTEEEAQSSCFGLFYYRICS